MKHIIQKGALCSPPLPLTSWASRYLSPALLSLTGRTPLNTVLWDHLHVLPHCRPLPQTPGHGCCHVSHATMDLVIHNPPVLIRQREQLLLQKPSQMTVYKYNIQSNDCHLLATMVTNTAFEKALQFRIILKWSKFSQTMLVKNFAHLVMETALPSSNCPFQKMVCLNILTLIITGD